MVGIFRNDLAQPTTDPFELRLSISSSDGELASAAIRNLLLLRCNDATWFVTRNTVVDADQTSSVFARSLRDRYNSLEGSKEDLDVLVEIAILSKGASLRTLAAMLAEKEVTIDELQDANANKALLGEIQSLADTFGQTLSPGLIKRFRDIRLTKEEKATLNYFLGSSFDAAGDLGAETVANIVQNPRLLARCQVELFLRPTETLTASDSDDKLLRLHQGLTDYIKSYPLEALDMIFSGATLGLGREDFENILTGDDLFFEGLDASIDKTARRSIGSTVLAVIAAIEDTAYRQFVLPMALRAAAANGERSFIGRHIGRMIRDGSLTLEECQAVECPFLDSLDRDRFFADLSRQNFAAVASLEGAESSRFNLRGRLLERAIVEQLRPIQRETLPHSSTPMVEREELEHVFERVWIKMRSRSTDQELQALLSVSDETFQKFKEDKDFNKLKIDMFIALELGRARGDRHGHLLQAFMQKETYPSIFCLQHDSTLITYGAVMGYRRGYGFSAGIAEPMQKLDLSLESRKLRDRILHFAAHEGIAADSNGISTTTIWADTFLREQVTARDISVLVDSIMGLTDYSWKWRLADILIEQQGPATAAYLIPRLNTFRDWRDQVTAMVLCVGGKTETVTPAIEGINPNLSSRYDEEKREEIFQTFHSARIAVLRELFARSQDPATARTFEKMYTPLLDENYWLTKSGGL